MYRLHLKSDPPESGTEHPSREEAFKVMKAGGFEASHKITFTPSPFDIENWQLRERDRFRNMAYLPVPWWEYEANWAARNYDTNEVVYPRFPHLSLKSPGQIAYTPSLEHGIADRQVTTRPGKYLLEFFAGHKHLHAEWIAKCSASATTLQIARTPDDIELVYVNSYGPISSCMGGTRSQRRGEYGWGRASQHPVRVYGNCELGVAYLGNLHESRGVNARCVVWVEKKIFTRTYGDETLRQLLMAHGYTHGNLYGAKIPAIHEGDGFLMPYVDGAEYASLSSDRKWLVLGSAGPYHAQTTDGSTDPVSGYECEGCGDNVDEDAVCRVDGEYYCRSCYDDRYFSCNHCGCDTPNDDGVEGANGGSYCTDCATSCALCDRAFVPRAYRLIVRREREARNVHDHVCERCDDGTSYYCESCNALYPANTDHGRDARTCTVCEPVDDTTPDDLEEQELDHASH